MTMTMRDLLRETTSSLEANRGRTLLTVLGIVIGIAAVISMTSLIGGMRNALVGSLGLNAARTVSIYVNGSGLSEQQVDSLRSAMPEYESLDGVTYGGGTVKTQGGSVQMTAMGCAASTVTSSGAKVTSGRLWSESEESSGANVCVLTTDDVRQIFGSADYDAVGKTFKLDSAEFTVVGIAETDSSMGQGQGMMWVPAQTCANLWRWAGSSPMTPSRASCTRGWTWTRFPRAPRSAWSPSWASPRRARETGPTPWATRSRCRP